MRTERDSERRLCNVVFTAQISSPSPRSAGLAPRRLPPSAPINHPTGAAALSGPIHPSAFSTRAGSGILGMKRDGEKNNFPSSSTLNPSGGASSPDEFDPLLGPFLFPFRFFLFAFYPSRPSRIDLAPLRLQNSPSSHWSISASWRPDCILVRDIPHPGPAFICPCPAGGSVGSAHPNESANEQRWEKRSQGRLRGRQKRNTHRWRRGSGSGDMAPCRCHLLIPLYF